MPIALKENTKGFVNEYYYTVNEIAGKCQVSRDTVVNWISKTGRKCRSNRETLYIEREKDDGFFHGGCWFYCGRVINEFLEKTGFTKEIL